MKTYLIIFFSIISFSGFAQLLQDDFDGSSTINTWYADDIQLNTSYSNPFQNTQNASSTVLRYEDNGGLYANLGLDSPDPIIIEDNSPFSFKIYVPSSGLTGNQNNQVSLKLQNRNQQQPWSNQTEIIKTVELNQWQTLTFDFTTDNYVNLDPSSAPPEDRTDFNRILIQVNGENNTDQVTAYIDDFYFQGGSVEDDPGNPNDSVYDVLVWADEFEGSGAIDTNNWFHQTLLPNGESWFNGEIQHYTDRLENTFLEGGNLNLVAKKENFTDQGVTKDYTSARLNSKFAFTYGRVEVRAKLPTGVGTWPAIWMLGKNIQENGGYWNNEGFGTTPWPACGEIDIMEHWGDNQNFVQSAMHTPSSFGGTINHGGQVVPTASTAFHVYTLDWYEDRMVFSVDGNVHYVYDPEVQNDATWPFDEEQYLLLNIAIQPSIDPNFTESAMEIDYVRVYQENTLSTNDEIAADPLKVYPNPTR
jgi:beta-glucanase (GH16 family)